MLGWCPIVLDYCWIGVGLVVLDYVGPGWKIIIDSAAQPLNLFYACIQTLGLISFEALGAYMVPNLSL